MRITSRNLDFSFAKTKREVFDRLFPLGAEVTVDNARRATDAGLSLRCAASQVMEAKQLSQFNQRVNGLLADYFVATADTLHKLRSLNPFRDKMAWIEADATHEGEKRTAWEPYLDGLAQSFVQAIQEAA